MGFGISLAMFKNGVKNMLLNIPARTGLPFFLFLICIICRLSDTWVLFLKQRIVHCVVSF